ncbi:MAG: nucleotidyltransferase family protein [Aliidongia sp.]
MTRQQDMVEWAQDDPVNAAILRRLPELGLGQAYLVAGCVYQAVWNRLGGLPPGALVKDYDIFYFDDADLSYEAEDAAIRRAAALFGDLDAEIELKNQARVHLWYPQRFGAAYPQLRSTADYPC